MPSVQFLWIISLVVELSVLGGIARRSWYRLYPRFCAYLAFDLAASLLLFWISLEYPTSIHPYIYDMTWRFTQLLLVIGRVSLVIESYQRMANVPTRWRFSDGLVYPAAGICALIAHYALVREPFRWPESNLETVYSLIGGSHMLMGFCLIGILVAAHRQQLKRSVQYRHAQILCAYLLLTGICYYNASQQPSTIGLPLMAVATLCYGCWFWCLMFSASPAHGHGEGIALPGLI